jgi:hypothetical protein
VLHFHMTRHLHKGLEEVRAVCCVTGYYCILSARKWNCQMFMLLFWYSLSLSCLTGYFRSSNFKQWCYTFHRSVATNNILCKFNSAPHSYTDNIYFNAETITCILHALPSWCSSSTLCHPLLYDQNIMINCSILCSPSFLPYSFPATLLLYC